MFEKHTYVGFLSTKPKKGFGNIEQNAFWDLITFWSKEYFF